MSLSVLGAAPGNRSLQTICSWMPNAACPKCKRASPLHRSSGFENRASQLAHRSVSCEAQSVSECFEELWWLSNNQRPYPMRFAHNVPHNASRSSHGFLRCISNLSHEVLVRVVYARSVRCQILQHTNETAQPTSTAKYVDECLDIVQLQYAKAVMTPLTEQKSLNLHDETTGCDQI